MLSKHGVASYHKGKVGLALELRNIPAVGQIFVAYSKNIFHDVFTWAYAVQTKRDGLGRGLVAEYRAWEFWAATQQLVGLLLLLLPLLLLLLLPVTVQNSV